MRIYKYEIAPPPQGTLTEVKIPGGADILHIGGMPSPSDYGLYLWARVNPNNQLETKRFHIVGTGQDIPVEVETAKYVATAFCGPYVWQIFEA